MEVPKYLWRMLAGPGVDLDLALYIVLPITAFAGPHSQH